MMTKRKAALAALLCSVAFGTASLAQTAAPDAATGADATTGAEATGAAPAADESNAADAGATG